MKRVKLIGAAALLALSVFFTAGAARSQEYDEGPAPVSVQGVAFYSDLAPYGDWIFLDAYGWVWRPAVAASPEWRPYTDGRWVWTTSYGWYWQAYEPWGWAPFHYGRWVIHPAYGWLWFPGTVWAPAWVEWRYSGSYVGWVALAPTVVVGATWYHGGVHHDHWVYVETRRFGDSDQHHGYVPVSQNRHAYSSTSQSHGYSGHGSGAYQSGPAKGTVEHDSGRKFTGTSVLAAQQPRTKSTAGVSRPVPPTARSADTAKPRPGVKPAPPARPQASRPSVAKPSPVSTHPARLAAPPQAPAPKPVVKPSPKASHEAPPARAPSPAGGGHAAPQKRR